MCSGGRPKQSPTPAPPPPPETVDPAVTSARDRERRRNRNAYGQQDTILTSGQGAALPATATGGTKTLLGS